MLVHHYHPRTLEYLGSTMAHASPLDLGNQQLVFLVPAHATTVAPPDFNGRDEAPGFLEREIPVYDLASDTWVVVPDRRGQKYWTPRGRPMNVDQIGFVPEIVDPPPGDLHQPLWRDGSWIEGRSPDEARRELEARIITLRQLLSHADGLSLGDDLARELGDLEARLKGFEP